MRFPKGVFLGIGITIVVLSVIQIASGFGFIGSVCPGIGCVYYATTLALAYVCPAVMNVITGSLAIGAACSRVGHRRAGLKNGFMVMCIMSALTGIIMTYFFFSLIGFTSGSLFRDFGALALVSGLAITMWINAICGIVLFILFIVGASYSCCCAPVSKDDEQDSRY